MQWGRTHTPTHTFTSTHQAGAGVENTSDGETHAPSWEHAFGRDAQPQQGHPPGSRRECGECGDSGVGSSAHLDALEFPQRFKPPHALSSASTPPQPSAEAACHVPVRADAAPLPPPASALPRPLHLHSLSFQRQIWAGMPKTVWVILMSFLPRVSVGVDIT